MHLKSNNLLPFNNTLEIKQQFPTRATFQWLLKKILAYKRAYMAVSNVLLCYQKCEKIMLLNLFRLWMSKELFINLFIPLLCIHPSVLPSDTMKILSIDHCPGKEIIQGYIWRVNIPPTDLHWVDNDYTSLLEV